MGGALRQMGGGCGWRKHAGQNLNYSVEQGSMIPIAPVFCSGGLRGCFFEACCPSPALLPFVALDPGPSFWKARIVSVGRLSS